MKTQSKYIENELEGLDELDELDKLDKLDELYELVELDERDERDSKTKLILSLELLRSVCYARSKGDSHT